MGIRYIINSDKDVHFTGAIAENDIEEENIAGLLSNKITITNVAIQAKENRSFDVMLFGKDIFADTDLNVDTFQSVIHLDIPTHGNQIGGANQYYLSNFCGLSVDYEDEDGTKELHIALRCRTAAGKTAGAVGEVKLTFIYIPRI